MRFDAKGVATPLLGYRQIPKRDQDWIRCQSSCLDGAIRSGRLSEFPLNKEDRLRGDARDLGLVRTVQSFQFDFDGVSKDGHAIANIRDGAGCPIWGVLYEVPEFLIVRETVASHGRKSLDTGKFRLDFFLVERIPLVR